MSLNRKGFTLIEVISVVLILGIIVAIVLPSVVGYLDTSKDRSEEIFVDEMERIIGEYVALEGRNIYFDTSLVHNYEKCDPLDKSCYTVKVYKNSTITFNDVISSGLLKENDIINPKTKQLCNINTPITVYRDEEYVYCYETRLDCVESTDDKNLIDTCNFNWDELS